MMYSLPSALVGSTIEPSKVAGAKFEEYSDIVSVEVINKPLFCAVDVGDVM